MLNKSMWSIFEKTGNIYAYLYVNEYNKQYDGRSKDNIGHKRAPLEIKEITII